MNHLTDILRISESSLLDIKLDTGMAYLRYQCSNDDWGYDLLVYEACYWQWFMGQWEIRDRKFVDEYAGTCLKGDGLVMVYRSFHSTQLAMDYVDKSYQELKHFAVKNHKKRPSVIIQ